MKNSVLATHALVLILLAGACGDGEGGSSGDGDALGDGDGDLNGDGDALGDGDGDLNGDGDALGDGDGDLNGDGDGDAPGDGDGDVPSSGGGSGQSGGAGGASGGMSGGAPSTGGSESTGGAQNGSGGLPGICECDAVSIPVCGVDGTTYDAGCGEECVPVDIECQGVCPCEGCGCQVLDVDGCEVGQRQWSCTGTNYSDAAFLAEDCDSVPVGSIRYCCRSDVVPDDFCE